MAMRQQIERKHTHRRDDEDVAPADRTAASADAHALEDELDGLLDEIDGVLEENAEEFVKSYVQKGGQ